MNPDQLRAWLADGKTDRVLDALLHGTPALDADLHQEATLISARYETLARAKRLGTLDFKDEQRERALITEALQEVVERLQRSERVTAGHPPTKRGFWARPWAKWGAGLVATVTVLAGIVQISGYSARDFVAPKTAEPTTTPTEQRPENPPAPVPAAQTSTPTTTQTTPAQVAPTRSAPSSPADTALTVACKSNKTGSNLRFKNGETMRFYVQVSQPCTLRFVYKLATGELVLLENDRPVTTAETGRWLEIGGGFAVAEPFGAERLYVFAQNAAFEPLRTRNESGYELITEGLPATLQKTRGFKKQHRFAETSLSLTTTP